MNREELYAMMDEKLGYAYVYEKGNNGKQERLFLILHQFSNVK